VYLAIKAGEADMGLAIGVEKMGKQGLLGAAGKARGDRKVFEPGGRYGAVMGVEGVLGTGLMPGVFAQAGMEYANEHDGVGFEQFAKVAEKNHAHSTLNPLAQYQKAFSLDEVMNAEMMSYPNTLLMCCPTGDGAAAVVLVSEERLRSLSPEQRSRAVKISASVMTSDPWTDTDQVQPDVNTLTRQAAAKAYDIAGVDPRTSTSSSCTTASRPPSSSTTTTYGCAPPARPGSSSTSAARGATARRPSTRRAGSSRRAIRSAPPASPTCTRSRRTCGAKPATARSRTPRSG
jgi:acetyl-CoA acetyltransferase